MVELEIERLGQHGDGIAPGPIFVPRTLPGEVVSGEIVDGRIARPRILTPSPDRVAAPCRHYKACGGCALQHTRDDVVTAFKVGVVQSALAAQGIEAAVQLVHASPTESRRRATISGRRTKNGAVVGFHGAQSDALTAIDSCIVLAPEIRRSLSALEAMTRGFGSRRGEMKFALTATRNGLDLNVSGAPMPSGPRVADAIELASDVGMARLSWDGEVVALFAPPVIEIDDVDVTIPPGAFLQATAEAEAALRAEVLHGLSDVAGPVVDLFAGIGTFSIPVARERVVHSVEGDTQALGALDAAWRQSRGRQLITTEVRDLFRRPLLPDELDRFSAAIIDPPRAGAAEQMRAIAHSRLKTVVHVSCNPATFARDAATLVAAGFTPGTVAVVDQFRWSPHVEVVSTFRR